MQTYENVQYMKDKFPSALIDEEEGWALEAFIGTHQLDPLDPFFEEVLITWLHNLKAYALH